MRLPKGFSIATPCGACEHKHGACWEQNCFHILVMQAAMHNLNKQSSSFELLMYGSMPCSTIRASAEQSCIFCQQTVYYVGHVSDMTTNVCNAYLYCVKLSIQLSNELTATHVSAPLSNTAEWQHTKVYLLSGDKVDDAQLTCLDSVKERCRPKQSWSCALNNIVNRLIHSGH